MLEFALHHHTKIAICFDVAPPVLERIDRGLTLAERLATDLENWLKPPAPPIVGVAPVIDQPTPR